jgi:hypothetical protein
LVITAVPFDENRSTIRFLELGWGHSDDDRVQLDDRTVAFDQVAPQRAADSREQDVVHGRVLCMCDRLDVF